MAAVLGDAGIAQLIDIGTGTGRMLELLAGQAEQALGFHRSSEMLRHARVKLAERGVDHVELRQADLRQEGHKSDLNYTQRISYADCCLKKNKRNNMIHHNTH